MSIILITGGCGFIGKHLSLNLRRHDVIVRILDNLLPQVHGDAPDLHWLEAAGIDLIRGSVSDPTVCACALAGVDVVVHLAAETGTGQSMYEMRQYVDTNVTGTATLLEACRAAEIKQLVLTSSRAVYGEGAWRCEQCGKVHPRMRSFENIRNTASMSDEHDRRWNPRCPICGRYAVEFLPTSEAEACTPTSVYGISKLAQEQLVSLLHTSGMICSTLRLFNVYGPGQSLSNPYTGVLGVFANRARLGKEIDLYEDGDIIRDFVYIEDVVRAIEAAIGMRQPCLCNIGSGSPTTIGDLASAVVLHTRSRSQVSITGNTRLGDVRGLVADIAEAERTLGWRPQVSLEEGLAHYLDWALASTFEDRYEQSLEELKRKGLYV